MTHPTSLLTARSGARVLLLLSLCMSAAACGSDTEQTEQTGSPWDLEKWQFTEPEPDMDTVHTPDQDRPDNARPGPDLGPAPDMGPIVVDMAPIVVDMDPIVVDMPATMLGLTGDACLTGDTCQSGMCIEDDGVWSQGYCSADACEQTSCALGGGTCIVDALRQESFCARGCSPDSPFSRCREGYECRTPTDSNAPAAFCLPTIVPLVTGVADGEACQADGDCTGGSCIPESDGWPQGYCTTIGCTNRDDCATQGGEDNRCYQNPQGPNFCVRMCQADSQCRTDYVCQPVGGGQGFCVPDPSQPLTEDFAQYPFAITCGPPNGPVIQGDQRHDVTFDVSLGTTSYMVTAIAKDGRQLFSENTTRPDGSLIDYFQGGNSYQNTTAQLFGWVSPIMTPAKPEFAAQIGEGTHTHRLYVESQEVCSYYLEESTPGTTIDLNVYLVGVPGVSAANAANSANLQATLNQFASIYSSFGITIDQRRYVDITGADLQKYRVVRSEADVGNLVALSQLPGPTRDEALSLNVFFVESIALGGGTIGISQGLPGPPGIHGTQASGVVFTSEFLGTTFRDPETNSFVDGNAYTGIVLAHELGHYLGLFHTTEQGAQGQDPLTDTPTCTRRQFPDQCADLNNLMFPFAGIAHTEVTPHQGFVIQGNPLTKD